MTIEYLAKCIYCNFGIIDDCSKEKIISRIEGHCLKAHNKIIVYDNETILK